MSALPRFACGPCRRLKKKCDRLEPKCTPCLRGRRKCAYSTASLNELPAHVSPEKGSPQSYGTAVSQYDERDSRFSAFYFLDQSLTQRCIAKPVAPCPRISPELRAFVGIKSDMHSHAVSFFQNIHPWISFINKKLFYERVFNSLASNEPENIILLAALKLLDTSPDIQSRSAVYCRIKAALADFEINGHLTLRILQALILVAIYELGHAIYPSSYLTIGHCARYGVALGIDGAVERATSKTSYLAGNEEERRTWWAIVIIDCYIHLGCPDKVPAIEESKAHSILPMDDSLWANNEIDSPVHTLSSPPSLAMGRFGLTVQASILLGKSLRNLRDRLNVTQDSLSFQQCEDEAKILRQAISTLVQVCSDESRSRSMGICGVAKMCISTQLILNARHAKDKWQGQESGENRVQESNLQLASHMLSRLGDYQHLSGQGCREEISPFLFDALYRSAVIYMQQYLSTGHEIFLEGLHEFRSELQRLNTRWKAADIYLRLLEANDTTGILQ